MSKKLSDKMLENLSESSTFDEVLEINNQLTLEEDGPAKATAEEMAETAKYIARIKQKSKMKIVHFSPKGFEELKEM
jgi:hypothetical protein